MLFANTIISDNCVSLNRNMACALFPPISNVKIKMVEIIKISQQKLKGLKRYRKMIASLTANQEESSCLMIFSNYCGSEMAYNMIQIASDE